ncbi:MAG: phage major capsid protein [Clostridia bacterium]|nr:phage major capsid protein [Clostridia bacterium]
MALKQIVLRKKIDGLRAQMTDAEQTRDALKVRRDALKLREEELEKAVGEINENTTAEEQAAIDEETAKWEQDDEALGKEENENLETTRKLQEQIDSLQHELDELDSRSKDAAKVPEREERKVETTMNTRKFFGMDMQQRDAFFKREDVKDFLLRVRELGGLKRAVSGSELLIPTVVLNLIRENIENYSKLYKHVNVRRVPGKARQTVMGTIPEAVWTEMCAKLNELNLSFTGVEVDGYKVGGYIAVCNAVLEDSDISLATEIISVLGQAIGLALDKAILYGTGTKMPIGIMTRLAQTADPGNEKNTIPWANLSTSNVLAITGKTDAALFKAMVEASGAAKGKYSRGSKFWAMNETTHTKLVANSLSINAAGAITAGQMGTMPVIGGAIEVLSFIPDDVIIGGYGDLYLLAERAGAAIAQSEHVRFIEDQTVFKGTARYDGVPVIAEGFVAIGIGGEKPTAGAVTFAEDTAN